MSLGELEKKLEASKTPFFGDSLTPSKSRDLHLYEMMKEFKLLPVCKEHPCLYSWYNLIGNFSEQARKEWKD
jgi:hypothetical protein